MRIAYFDCYSGVSGNMALGAAVDAGANKNELRRIIAALGLKNYSITFKNDSRQGMRGTYVAVKNHDKKPIRRHLANIEKLISRARIEPEIKENSIKVFRRLAQAEARVHGCSMEKIHFHEVGAVDAIVDIVGTVAALRLLEVKEVYSSPLKLGSGEVECAHGRLPVPAPATLELLKGVPVAGDSSGIELVTPTGAALVTTLAGDFGPIPQMRLEKTGCGLGTVDIPGRPNLLRLMVGSMIEAGETVIQIQANIDDMSPEYYDFLFKELMALNAVDVAIMPVQMKKNRPGVMITVLARAKDRASIIDALLNHSTTLGVRYHEVMRKTLERKTESVDTRYGKIRAKRAFRPDGSQTLHFEYDDLMKAAERSRVSLYRVEREARSKASHNAKGRAKK